jgi:hypothetical protein
MRSWVQVRETTSCRNAVKSCVHNTQSGRTLPQTLRKQELCAPGYPICVQYMGCHDQIEVPAAQEQNAQESGKHARRIGRSIRRFAFLIQF